MCGPEDPPFTPLLYFAKVPFQALKRLFTRPPYKKNLEMLASTPSIFAQILALKPPNLKLSVHKTLLSQAKISLQAPHFGNLGRTPLLEKKLSAPPPPPEGGKRSKGKGRCPWCNSRLGFWGKVLQQLKYESFEHKLVYMFYGFPPSFFSLVSEPYNNNGSL